MNRRAFIGGLAALAVGHVLDLEKLLWVPGAKTIFIPPPHSNKFIPASWITQDALLMLRDNMAFAQMMQQDYAVRWAT